MAFYRGLDPTTGRWMQVDPLAEIDHSGSPYRHAFNNPISFNDSDGDTPVHAVAAVIGAGINVFNNWDKVLKNPWSAIGYAATGAVAGAASLAPGGAIAAAKITAAGNFATDIVSGNIPDIKSVEDAFGYVANSAMNALDVAGAGKLAKAGLKGLGKLGLDWATEAVHATGEWAFSEVTSEIVGSSVGGTAFGTVVTDFKMEWVVKVGMGPIGFGSAGRSITGDLGLTKSTMANGREQHRQYKINDVDKNAGKFKEYGRIKGIRPDFVDVPNKTVYELKPNNPASIKRGKAQLKKYKKLLSKTHGGRWKGILDLY